MIQYPWLSIIYNQILQSYYLNRGHHALIVYSKEDYGETMLIYNIAQWLICENRHDMKYCNICHNCNLIRIGYHPDFYQLDIEPNMQSIGIEIIRSCLDALYKSSHCSKSKIVFIKYTEYLTHQAANILLKTVEEPPDNTFFFLRTRNEMKIPVTLTSRCVKWVINPPTESQGLIWLMQKQKNIDILSAQTALRLSYGSPLKADSMFRLNFWQHRMELCKIIEEVIISGNFLKLLPCLSKTRQYDNQSIYWLITILIDALKWQQKVHKNFLINLDQLNLISDIAIRWSMLSLTDQVDQWLIVLRYFQKLKNINQELLLVYRLLNWKTSVIENSF